MSRAIPETLKKAGMYSYVRVEKPKNNAVKRTESEAWDRSKHWVFPLRGCGLIQDVTDSVKVIEQDSFQTNQVE